MRQTASKMAYSMDDIEQALDGCAEDKEVATIVDGFQSLDSTAQAQRAPEKQEVLVLSSRAWNNPKKGKGKVAKISKMFEENNFPVDLRKRQAMDGERPWLRDLKLRDQRKRTDPLPESQQQNRDTGDSKQEIKSNKSPIKSTETRDKQQNGHPRTLQDSLGADENRVPTDKNNVDHVVPTSATSHVDPNNKTDSEGSILNNVPVPNETYDTTGQTSDIDSQGQHQDEIITPHHNGTIPTEIHTDTHTQEQDKEGVDHSHHNGNILHASGDRVDATDEMYTDAGTYESTIDTANHEAVRDNVEHPQEGDTDGMPFVMESAFARSLQQKANLRRQSKVEQTSTDSDAEAAKTALRHHPSESGIVGSRHEHNRYSEEADDLAGDTEHQPDQKELPHLHQNGIMARHHHPNGVVPKFEDSGIGFGNSDLALERENGLTPLSSDGSVRTSSSTEDHRDILEPDHEQTLRKNTRLRHRDNEHGDHPDVRPKGRHHVKFEDDRKPAVNGLPNGHTESTRRARDQWTQDQAIVKCSYLSNELVRMSELLDTMDPQDLKAALKRRLKRKDAKQIMALSLLLPRHRHPPATQLHCVRCHKNYNPRFDSERCALSHPNNCVVKKKEHSTSTTFKCRACFTEFRLTKMTFYQEGVNSYMTGLCFSGKHTTNSKDVVYQCHGGPAKTCEDNGCVLYYV